MGCVRSSRVEMWLGSVFTVAQQVNGGSEPRQCGVRLMRLQYINLEIFNTRGLIIFLCRCSVQCLFTKEICLRLCKTTVILHARGTYFGSCSVLAFAPIPVRSVLFWIYSLSALLDIAKLYTNALVSLLW